MVHKGEDMLYDLYGVVNHSGSLNFGHYTAQAFNTESNKWHNFNDSMVSEVKGNLQEDIVTPRAYVLFYRKRGFNPSTKAHFDSIKLFSTGKADHLLKIPVPTTAVKKEEEKKQNETPALEKTELIP